MAIAGEKSMPGFPGSIQAPFYAGCCTFARLSNRMTLCPKSVDAPNPRWGRWNRTILPCPA